MKKLSTILAILVILSLVLMGCANSTSTTSNKPTTSSAAAASTAASAKPTASSLVPIYSAMSHEIDAVKFPRFFQFIQEFPQVLAGHDTLRPRHYVQSYFVSLQRSYDNGFLMNQAVILLTNQTKKAI